MMEIKPNEWYTLGAVFEEELNRIDRYRHKLMEGKIDFQSDFVFDSPFTFKNSSFTLMIGNGIFSDESLTSYRGQPIYYPLDIPDLSDVSSISTTDEAEIQQHPLRHLLSKETIKFLADRESQIVSNGFGELSFLIVPARREDLIGQPYHDKDYDNLGTMVQQYRYQLNLRSPMGAFASETLVPNDWTKVPETIPSAYFSSWLPLDSTAKGLLYVPLDSQKLSSLEIMLEEKKT